MEQPERIFTRDQANALLPTLRPLIADLIAAQRVIADPARVESARTGAAANGGGSSAGELMEGAERFQRAATELQDLGVVIRDPTTGLVDFPATIGGRPAYLCWRIDEDAVDHWHDRDAGFIGRQPL